MLAKDVYQELADYLAQNYGFSIDISKIASAEIGSPEERWKYLLRETERSQHGDETMTIANRIDKTRHIATKVKIEKCRKITEYNKLIAV